MLTTASTPSPRARLVVMAQGSFRQRTCLFAGVSMFASRQAQQYRRFRFGPWASRPGSDSPPQETRRRQRILRCRYMDFLNRKLSWEINPRYGGARAAVWGAMSRFSQKRRSPAGGECASIDDPKSWSDGLSSMRPGRNIEDVEREAMDHLIGAGSTSSQRPGPWSSLDAIRKYLHTQRPPTASTPASVSHDASSTQEQGAGFIDPITNRRVIVPEPAGKTADPLISKHKDANQDAPATKRQTSKAPMENKSMRDAPKAETQHPSTNLNDPQARRKLTDEEKFEQYQDLNKYRPVYWREPDGLHRTTSEEDSKNYKDLSKYSPGKFDDPNAQQPLSPEETSKIYDDLDSYKPVSWNEPDGFPEQTAEERSKNYDDLDKYGAVRWNEPDGLNDPTPEELSRHYKDLGRYGPVKWNEPDGLRKPTPEEVSKQYKDLGTYREPFVADDAVLQAHKRKQQMATETVEPIPAKVQVHLEDPAKQYDDVDKYGPVHWNEPDGLRKLTPEELSKNYKDLSEYSNYDNAGPATPRVHPEEASRTYRDLDKYKHQQMKSEMPSRACATPLQEAKSLYPDLSRYRPVMHNEPDGKPSGTPDPAVNGLDAYDAKTAAGAEVDASPIKSRSKRRSRSNHHEQGVFEASQHSLDWKTASDIRAEALRKTQDGSQKAKLQKAKSEQELKWDVTSKDALDTIRHVKQKAGGALTGNYVQDFPEEFATSWNTVNSPSKSTLYPKNRSEDGQFGAARLESQTSEKQEAELSSMDESFPSEESKLEPALNRGWDRRSSSEGMSQLEKKAAEEDPYSKVPQGLQTSYSEECGGRPTWPTLVRHYQAKGPKEAKDSVSAVQAADDRQPASYKILAYDSATECISVAETTSGVLDTQSPSSPAAVLPRLSNPAKFLAHFKSLHLQGYEIVSGGGDVLVFRKVGPGSPEASNGQSGEARQAKAAAVNPIDMMGKPVTGNFASPTGFVNYNALADGGDNKPSPPFRTKTDSTREEACSKGRLHKERKRSVGRKLAVGTVWVAGVAYAVGVLGEYFATGGVDGLGPKSL